MVFRLGIVAGEPSGDALGARVVSALRAQLGDDLSVEGIGGPALISAGCTSLYPMESLSVMGLTEPLLRLPRLLKIRAGIARHFRHNPPQVFLGIDSPDFNLALERRLRHAGTPTAHLVSPSLWAWRPGRIKTIERAVDRMLYLFPFEAAPYARSKVAHEYVGHPLADEVPLVSSQSEARQALALAGDARVVALLPGSRAGEIRSHGPLFLEVARRLQARDPGLSFVLPVASAGCAQLLQSMLPGSGLPVQLCSENALVALAAADVALIASGTATLEAALVKRPMVVAYRTGALSWALLSRLVRVDHVALPNLLAGERLVPEFLQDAASADVLADALWQQLENGASTALQEAYNRMHLALRRGCAERVGQALLELGERHVA